MARQIGSRFCLDAGCVAGKVRRPMNSAEKSAFRFPLSETRP